MTKNIKLLFRDKPDPATWEVPPKGRLIIIDQTLDSFHGHHAEYTLSVAFGAAKHLPVIVMANQRCSIKSTDSVEVLPVFRFAWTQPQRVRAPSVYDPVVSFSPWPFLSDLRSGLELIDASPDDQVFIHSIGFAEVEDILALLLTNRQSKLPLFHILLRRDLDELMISPIRFKRFSAHVRAFAELGLWPAGVRFYTDTDALTEQYSTAMGVQFETLPIPFSQATMEAALRARQTIGVKAPVLIGYLGDARPEKGYQFLPAMVEKLMRDYVLTGKARFRLQSNYNLPGGEPGIPQAKRALKRFGPKAVELLDASLSQQDYYRHLAEMDIIVIPYLAERYARRSSGIFAQAVAAGKITVVPAGTSMAIEAEEYQLGGCVVYDRSEDLANATALAIRDYDLLATAAQESRGHWCQMHSVDALVGKLLEAKKPGLDQSASRLKAPLILHVIDGHSSHFQTGAAAVQNGQLRFLNETGYRHASVFVVKSHPSDPDFALWMERANEYWFKSGSAFCWLSYYILPPKQDAPSLMDDIKAADLLSIPDSLKGFVRSGKIDLVWTNYITSLPLLQNLGVVGRVPIVLETHDIQSYQYAIRRGSEVDDEELSQEMTLIAQADRIVSISEPETLCLAAHLGLDRIVTAAPVSFEAPLSIEDLAAAQDLGEVVSSAQSDLSFVDFNTAMSQQELWQFSRLVAAQGIDLLFVSSIHDPNMISFDWFLEKVYAPYLAPLGVNLLLAGALSSTDWALERQRRFPETIFLAGRVGSLRPLYAAAKVVILPITAGAGVNIKTVEALGYGKPIAATSLAFRGLASEVEGFPTFDEPIGFAARIRELLASDALRRDEAERSWRSAAARRDIRRFFETLSSAVEPLLQSRALPIKYENEELRFEFVEWRSAYTDVLNRFARGLLENLPYIRDLVPPLVELLDRHDTQADLFRVLHKVSFLQDSYVQRTQTYLAEQIRVPPNATVTDVIRHMYIRAFLPAELGRLTPRALAGCKAFADILDAAHLRSYSERDQVENVKFDGIDIAILLEDRTGNVDRQVFRSFVQFFEESFLPYLSEKGVTLAVIGEVRDRRIQHDHILFVGSVSDPSPILAAARIIVAPWNTHTILNPMAFEVTARLLCACKPLVASRAALWFLGDGIGYDSPKTSADIVLSLLRNETERLMAARQTIETATKIFGQNPQWLEWQRVNGSSRQLMETDARLLEWNEWLSQCGGLIQRAWAGAAISEPELMKLKGDMENPTLRAGWEEMLRGWKAKSDFEGEHYVSDSLTDFVRNCEARTDSVGAQTTRSDLPVVEQLAAPQSDKRSGGRRAGRI